MTLDYDKLAEAARVATPGPWQWDAGIIPPDGPGHYADIYVMGEDREPIIIAEFNDRLPEGRDNARLIVAAPQLLADNLALREREKVLREALETVRDYVGDVANGHTFFLTDDGKPSVSIKAMAFEDLTRIDEALSYVSLPLGEDDHG